jgi:hypothetical protein
MNVPISASVMIRACFSEENVKHRAGACHDEYTFNATLTPDKHSTAEMPVLHYRTKATSFPGHVSRYEDSLTKRPLRKKDLVTVIDTRCSFELTWHFDPIAQTYQPDKPVPDCSNYYVP